ncbi:MAG: hypothetical protein WCK01_03860 [Candidatus Uhrbacteria bacterium]
MKHIDNLVLIFVLIFVTIVSGCGASVWSGPRGHGTSIAGISDVSSTAEYHDCISDRERQRTTLLRQAGVLPTEAPTTTTITVGYRDAVQLICEQDDRREPEPRHISREDCSSLLASIDSEASGEVATTVTPPPTPSVTDPTIMRILMMNPALRQDDVAFCMNASSSYGAPSAGGYGSMYGSGMSSGCIPGIAGCGITPYGAY